MITNFRPRVRSRHPSHGILKPSNKNLPLFPFKSVIRLGSTTDMRDTVTNGGNRIEINTIDAVKNSSNKLLMKTCFNDDNVKTADWWTFDGDLFYKNNNQEVDESEEDGIIFNIENLPYPIISKNIYGSRGTGNKKHDNQEQLEQFLNNCNNTGNYIFEKFYNYAREYRVHVTPNGYFYTCRKMLKRDTPQEHKWYRNDDHCVWVLEENNNFDKPINWGTVVNESIKALDAVGLDIGAVDIKIKSARDNEGALRSSPDFIIIEINSAPSFGDKTEQKYLEEIPKLLMNKYNKNGD